MMVDVIVPAYKPGEKFKQLLTMLAAQSYPIHKVIVVNTEKAYWDKEFEQMIDMEVHHIAKEEFDHGATRHLAIEYSQAEIVICMTDDAVPADRRLVQELVDGLNWKGPHGETVIEAYARQLPDKDCSLVEAYTRSFNYPEQSRVKTKDDLKELGIKTFFASNVCCAYWRELYLSRGGFIRETIFNEDMIFAGKAIQAGYAVAYAAGARVTHSHNYYCLQQLRRNFDLAVSQADHPEVFKGIRSESEGIRLVKQSASYLIRRGRFYLLPDLVLKSGFKYLGYRLGKSYKRLPKKLVMMCTMYPDFWKKRYMEERL